MKPAPIRLAQNATDDPELESLLHPAAAFDHPRDVVDDPDLTLNEKRAILSSWASDACAVESKPALRQPPGARAPVSFDEVVDALRTLDSERTRAAMAKARAAVIGLGPRGPSTPLRPGPRLVQGFASRFG